MSVEYFYFLNFFFVDFLGYENKTLNNITYANDTLKQQYTSIYEIDDSVLFPLTDDSPFFSGEVDDLSHIFYLKGISYFDIYSISHIWSSVCVRNF